MTLRLASSRMHSNPFALSRRVFNYKIPSVSPSYAPSVVTRFGKTAYPACLFLIHSLLLSALWVCICCAPCLGRPYPRFLHVVWVSECRCRSNATTFWSRHVATQIRNPTSFAVVLACSRSIVTVGLTWPHAPASNKERGLTTNELPQRCSIFCINPFGIHL